MPLKSFVQTQKQPDIDYISSECDNDCYVPSPCDSSSDSEQENNETYQSILITMDNNCAASILHKLEKSCENIRITDRETTADKIKHLVKSGYQNLQVVADFDGTLTKSVVNGKPAAHTLDVFARVATLSAVYHEGRTSLAGHYLPQLNTATDESEKHQVLVNWWNDHEALCVGELAPITEIQKASEEVNTPLRDECEDMLALLAHHGVPLTVVSAGVGEIIEYQLQKFKPSIVSNFIKLDENDCILSFTQPLVSVYNKDKIKLLANEQRHNVIVLGDSLGDFKMADSIPSAETILKIGFFTGESQNELENYMNVYDIVIIKDQTMHVLMRLLELIENQPC